MRTGSFVVRVDIIERVMSSGTKELVATQNAVVMSLRVNTVCNAKRFAGSLA